MTIRGIFFIGLFGTCCLWALSNPFAGIVAYAVHYHSFPERSWGGSGLADLGVRYSYTITLFLTVGTLLNLKKLPYGRLVTGQEILYLAFLGWIFLGRQMSGQQTETDLVDKMMKMAVFVLALTHIVVTPRRYEQFTWLMVSCALYLGFEGYTAPAGAYYKGRLNGIGGPDFGDTNALGAHMLVLLPIIGVRFIRGRWKAKLFSFVAGGLAANTIVATRSRAAYIGALVGVIVGLVTAPKGGRKKLWPLVILGAVGSLVLVDEGFVERMTTLEADKREKDESANDRLDSWAAGMRMFRDHPLGVGPGNFAAHMGRYLANHEGRDTHNTYIRCAAELGVPGVALFSALIVNAFWMMRLVARAAADREGGEELAWQCFALRISLIMYLICGIFCSFNYVEMMWWLLLLPSALERVVANANPIDHVEHAGQDR